MAPTRVTVPSSAAQNDRRSFTLNLPRNAGVAVIPHLFYMRYRRRLGTSLLFVDQHGDIHRMTLHCRRFSGTITSGLGWVTGALDMASAQAQVFCFQIGGAVAISFTGLGGKNFRTLLLVLPLGCLDEWALV